MPTTRSATAQIDCGCLDMRRKHQIATAGPKDHSGEVILAPMQNFDLDMTIFGSLEGALPRTVVRSKLALDMYWSEKAIQRIEANFTKVPRAPAFKSDVMTFMQEDCNFSMEHADGSFMDHLRFCWEYCHANYKDKSPVPLLLHSIMGVGTNFFPMGKDKIPKLKQLVSEEDFGHIECFPSVLRLLIHQDLLNELLKKGDKIKNLRSISFFRVIDNGELTMDAETFFDHLNYHLCHLLDFLPATSWLTQTDDGLFDAFIKLHKVLTDAGKLKAKVNFDLRNGENDANGLPLTLGSFIRGILPTALSLKLSKKAIAKFSSKIGHTITYSIDWGESQ